VRFLRDVNVLCPVRLSAAAVVTEGGHFLYRVQLSTLILACNNVTGFMVAWMNKTYDNKLRKHFLIHVYMTRLLKVLKEIIESFIIFIAGILNILNFASINNK